MPRLFYYSLQSIIFLILIILTTARGEENNRNVTKVNQSSASVRQFGGGLGAPLFFLIGLGIAFAVGITSLLIPLAGFLINSIQTMNANTAATLAATQANTGAAAGGAAGTGGAVANPVGGAGAGAGGAGAGGGGAGAGGRRKRNAHYQQWSDRFIMALETLDLALKKTYTS